MKLGRCKRQHGTGRIHAQRRTSILVSLMVFLFLQQVAAFHTRTAKPSPLGLFPTTQFPEASQMRHNDPALPNNGISPWHSSNIRLSSSTMKLSMALIPLAVDDLHDLVDTGPPTAQQYSAYFGRTKREEYGRLLEAAIVSVIGLVFSYFLSFVLGGIPATILGSFFLFYALLIPEFKAYQRNWEFTGGRPFVDDELTQHEDGLYGGLFLGRIGAVTVVEEASSTQEFSLDHFQDYTMENDELEQYAGTPYLLRIRLQDDCDRELQVHARLSEEYLSLQPGQGALCILLSIWQTFDELAALSDVWVPQANCWIGDYPYLNRPAMEELLQTDDDIWHVFQQAQRPPAIRS